REIALQHLNLVAQVYKQTGTIWENYSPEREAPGNPAKRDFVGWSGIGPILYLLRYGIGLKPDAPHNTLFWELKPGGRRGCDRFRFNGHVVSLIARYDDQLRITRIKVDSDGEFTLKVLRGPQVSAFTITKGRHEITVE